MPQYSGCIYYTISDRFGQSFMHQLTTCIDSIPNNKCLSCV